MLCKTFVPLFPPLLWADAPKTWSSEGDIAQDTGAGQGDIIVDLQMVNEAARRQKLAEAEVKRLQNALPVWHQRSTVSETLRGSSDRTTSAVTESEGEEPMEEVGAENIDTARFDCKRCGRQAFISLSDC